jgi:hypothetical protein
MNCFDYNAQVLECMEYRDESKTEPLLGVKYTAQSALFASAANANFNTQYCEGNYIELETEIWPDMADIDENFKGDRFLMFWVDGVPTGVKTFTTGTRFY